MKKPLVLTAAAAATALAAAAPGASARTITIYAGTPPGVKLPAKADLQGFYPRRPVARVGDTLRIAINTFGGIAVAPRSVPLPPALVRFDQLTYNEHKDAAGNPFWFSGKQAVGFAPQTVRTSSDGRVDGKALDYSGVPLGAATFQLKLAAAGTFVLGNALAPTLNTTLKVVRRGKKAPSASRIRKAALREARRDAATARKLAAFAPDGSVIHAGHDRGRIALLDFFPRKVSVKQGGSLRFMVDSRVEIHNVAFGPADYLKGVADRRITVISDEDKKPALLILGADTLFPSDEGTLPPLTKSVHGNGFLNTGLMDQRSDTSLPKDALVTFGEVGTFEFQCTLHPDMKGTVEVTA